MLDGPVFRNDVLAATPRRKTGDVAGSRTGNGSMNQSEYYAIVQQRMRELRLKKKLRQTDVAKFLGFHRHNVTLMEAGINRPTAWSIYRLEELFGEKLIT